MGDDKFQRILLDVKEGKNVAVFGPAGCGKSTLIDRIRLIAVKTGKSLLVTASTG